MRLLFIFLLFIAHSAVSQTIATVLFTAKKAIAQHGGVERTIARGASLEEGDTIITAADSTVRFRYLNGTLVTIGADSIYKIVAYGSPKSDVAINAELNKGKLQSETTGIKKRELLKAGVVALAITGTKYNVFVSSTTKVNVQIINGTVEANGQAWGAGTSFVATPEGVHSAPFPKEGAIAITPSMESATKGEVVSTSTTGTSSTSTSASVSTQANTNGAAVIGLLATTTVAGQSLNSSAAAVATVPLVDISITGCSPIP